MSASELFLYILLVIIVQVVAFSILAFVGRLLKKLFRPDRSTEASHPETTPPRTSTSLAPSWSGFRDFRVERRIFESPDESICSFYLKPVDDAPLPSYKPGQYLTFQLPVIDPASGKPKNIIRCYSLSDRPGKDHYRVSIKRVLPPGDVPDAPPGLSSNFFHDAIQEGDHVFVKPPGGHFFLKDGNGPVVLIAGGIGITPMLSMLNETLEQESDREIWLFYGVRNSADHAMKGHLKTLDQKHPNFRLHVCYSSPGTDDREGRDYQHAGRVDIALLRQLLSLQVYDFYVCGPRPMLETIVPALEDWGVADENIHYEAFGPASLFRASREEPSAGQVNVSVTFSKSGKTLTWDGSTDSLLEFAEDNGIHIDSGCRAGGCGSCQTTIEDGDVDYLQEPDFDADPGTCLMCVSRPKQDLVLEA